MVSVLSTMFSTTKCFFHSCTILISKTNEKQQKTTLDPSFHLGSPNLELSFQLRFKGLKSNLWLLTNRIAPFCLSFPLGPPYKMPQFVLIQKMTMFSTRLFVKLALLQYLDHFNTCPLNNLLKFEIFKWNILKYPLFSFTIFFDLEEIIFEIFSISEYNIINVEWPRYQGNFLEHLLAFYLAPYIIFCLIFRFSHDFPQLLT